MAARLLTPEQGSVLRLLAWQHDLGLIKAFQVRGSLTPVMSHCAPGRDLNALRVTITRSRRLSATKTTNR